MAKPTSENEVTVRRLSDVVVGVWDKVKSNTISDIAWDSTNKKLTKTKNGTTSDVVTSGALQSALAGSIADGNTGFVTGDAAYDALALKAPLASPTFTGTPKAPTAATGTNTTQIATTAFVKTAVDTAIAGVADALIYKGTVAGGSTGSYGALTPAANKGDTYKVSTAGKVDGKVVEVGDMLICNTDNTAQATDSNYSTIAANWDVIQANIDGAVTGPSSSTAGHIATFNSTNGKEIKDSGYTIATSVPSGAVFTDTKVTSVEDHYTPATDSGAEKDASGGTATQLPTTNGTSNVQVVTGITMDAKGHVTGVVSKGLYSQDTTYESKSAVSGGSDVSLCTTGEKYTWNNKQSALTFDGNYNASTNKAATVSSITSRIGALDVTVSGMGPGKTIETLTETDGKIAATFQNISITKSQVSDFGHTHGNISNTGTLTDTAAAAAGNDYVVIRDASDNKIQTSTIKGTDVADAVSNKHSHSSLTLSTTAKAYDGTHTLALPSTDPYTSARTPTSHTHGNISNDGAITTSGALASGDALVFVDSDDSSKLKKTPITFDGSTATKCLTQKGTWETFASSNTDTKVTQTLVASDNTSEYPILLAPTGQTATATTTSNFVTGAKYKPSTNTLSVNVSGNAATATSATTATNYASSGGIATALAGKASSGHTHTTSLATDTGTSSITLASAGKYKLTAGGTNVIFTMPTIPTVNNAALKIGLNGGTATSKFTANASSDATLTFATGSANGTIAVDGTNVAVKGLGSAAYTASTAYATSGHTHTTSMAESTSTSSLTLEVGKTYSISAGGTSYVFTNGTEMTNQEVTDLLAALT